ncbi:MAG: HepT-like ribonuclease domain-containing protein [Planctomycetota bacterium]|jgi:uncharacterized protein with HEPN domain
MRHDPGKLREDILRSIEEIETFCQGKTFHDFQEDRALELIIERELEIIGEALARLRRDHPNLAEEIRDVHKVVGLRNVLAHGYDVLEHEILWDIVENKLPILKADILKLT